MTHESRTEGIFRDILREKGYYDDNNIIIEEKKSDNPRIDKLLKTASKSGNGCGYPEFIISFKNKPENLIVVECKKAYFFMKAKIEKIIKTTQLMELYYMLRTCKKNIT